MAVRDGGKRTRFACLETARGMVAITVSVLTVAVVVMVTIAALRDVEFRLSIVNGMDSNVHWLSKVSSSHGTGLVDTTTLHAAVNTTGQGHAGGGNSSNGIETTSTTTTTTTTTTQQVAKQVNLTFALLAYNPSGRKEIQFCNFSVRVLDMPNFPSFNAMRDIATFPVPRRFVLKRQGMHKLWYKFPLSDNVSLSYVADEYGAEGTFEAMVLVNASIVGSGSGNSEPRTYYCWPVLVGWFAARESPGGGVTCTPRKELSIDVDSLLPPSESWSSVVHSCH